MTTAINMVFKANYKASLASRRKHWSQLKPLFFFLALTGCSAAKGFAADYSGPLLYRYTNQAGEVVISSHVPGEVTHRGYEVLSTTGRVLEIIKHEPSDKEKATARQRWEDHRKKKAQAKEDADLLRLFSSTREVDQTLKRQLKEIDNRIRAIEQNIEQEQPIYQQQQARIAARKREGRQVSDGLIQNIKILQASRQRSEQTIADYQKEKEQLRVDYTKRKERLRFLLETQSRHVEKNENLKLTRSDLSGKWLSTQSGSEITSWEATEEGLFLMVRKGDYGSETWLGRWSLNHRLELVVLYFQREFTRAGRTVKESFAKEKRYQILDNRESGLYLRGDKTIIRFQKAS